MKTSQHLNFLMIIFNGAIQQKRRRSILSLFLVKQKDREISGIKLINILVAHFLDFFSVLQLFVASHCRLQTRVTCHQTRAKSLLNMTLRVISLVERATGSMVTQ